MSPVDILYKLDKYNKHLFDIPVDEQINYMNSLGGPKSDIDRSYKQFLCQEYFSPLWLRMFWSMTACVIIPILLIAFWWKGRKVHFEYKVDTIAEKKGMDEIFPQELLAKCSICREEWNAGKCFTNADIRYLFRNVFGRRRPYFILKAMMHIALFSARITRYAPEKIITQLEFSFCSSLLTDYCHNRNVKLINVMHGEKLLNIRDSFFHFDECYVWDQHYVDMFVKLNAEVSQFRIAIPPSLLIDCNAYQNSSVYADYKYYLAHITDNEMESIVKSMTFVKDEGKRVKYRIHPKYTDITILRKYVKEDEIELPKNVSILESISNMEYAVGSYTTVLLQSYLAGKKVLIDDVTYCHIYEQLKEYGYMLVMKVERLERLSEKQ